MDKPLNIRCLISQYRRVIDLKPNDISILQKYTENNLPEKVWKNNYLVIRYAASKIPYLVSMFNNYDLVLCPGDSPSKYVEVIEDTGIKMKGTHIVNFPISGLGSEKGVSIREKELIKDYLLKVLDEYIGNKRIGLIE